jgi:hypothetical protein
MTNNINSGNDYAQLLIDTILKAEREIPENEQMPIDLLTIWVESIQEAAEQSYLDYVTGKRETFLLSDVEMKDLFEKAGRKYVIGLIDNNKLPISELHLTSIFRGYSGIFNNPFNANYGLMRGWDYNINSNNGVNNWWDKLNNKCVETIPLSSYTQEEIENMPLSDF